jgi:hypothetical protein
MRNSSCNERRDADALPKPARVSGVRMEGVIDPAGAVPVTGLFQTASAPGPQTSPSDYSGMGEAERWRAERARNPDDRSLDLVPGREGDRLASVLTTGSSSPLLPVGQRALCAIRVRHSANRACPLSVQDLGRRSGGTLLRFAHGVPLRILLAVASWQSSRLALAPFSGSWTWIPMPRSNAAQDGDRRCRSIRTAGAKVALPPGGLHTATVRRRRSAHRKTAGWVA